MNATLNKQNKRNQCYVTLCLVHLFFCIDYMKLFIYVHSAYIINMNKIQIEYEKNVSLCACSSNLYKILLISEFSY